MISSSPAAPTSRLPLSAKIGWGVGGLVENFMAMGIAILALPIFNIGFGIDAVLLGWAMALPRMLDAIIDPLIGNISDNTRSRWGRRRPYILLAGILCSVFFVVLWSPPLHWEKDWLFGYFAVTSVFFYLAFAWFSVPFNALGLELTSDYHERTRVQAWRFFFLSISGIGVAWLYKLSFLDVFTGGQAGPNGHPELIGIRGVALCAGLVIALAAIVPFFACREGAATQFQEKIRLLPALRLTFTNRSFLILSLLVIFTLLGVFMVEPFALYIGIYHVCNGDKELAATLAGWIGVTKNVVAILSIAPVTFLATRIGKKNTLFVGHCLLVVAFILTWFCFTPLHPWAMLLPFVFLAPGLTCFLILGGSLLADVCDLDELNCGLRREGMYGASSAFIAKFAFSTVTILNGYLLRWAGFQSELPEQSPQTVLALRLMFALVPLVLIAVGFLLTLAFPIGERRSREIRAALALQKINPMSS